MLHSIRRLPGLITGIALTLGVLASERAAAQSCFVPGPGHCPSEVITGSISPGDGSTPIPGPIPGSCAEVFVCDDPVTDCNAMHTGWGSSEAMGFKSDVDLLFRARGSDYYMSPLTGGGHCNPTGGSCWKCLGEFDIQLYAKYGDIGGLVTNLPSGEPGRDLVVEARYGTCGAYADIAYTDASGTYDFGRGHGPQRDSNNWGVFLKNLEEASGLVTESYTLTACGDCSQFGAPAKATSSQQSNANLVCWTDLEDPSIRPPTTGPGCGPVDPGKPVNVTTGNVYLDQADVAINGIAAHGLRFTRAYNSANAEDGRYGVFGPGWSHNYEKRLEQPPEPGHERVLRLRDSNGVPAYFQDKDGNSVYETSVPFTLDSTLTRQGDGSFIRQFRAGGSERYAALPSGRLTAIVDASGNSTNLGYNLQGKLTTIADGGGRQLSLAYDGLTITLSGPGEQLIATFTLDSETPRALSSVAYADGDGDQQPDGSFTFDYVTVASFRRLRTVTDGTGRVVETHEYWPDGKGRTSSLADQVEEFEFAYEPLKTVVTDARGNVTTYEYTSVWGTKLVTKRTGPCAACGGSESEEWDYDSKGRVTSHRDGEGNVTGYTYDPVTGDRLYENRAVQTGGPVTHTKSFTYYPDGRLHTRTEPNGGVTTFVHGPAGPTSITQQLTSTQSRVTLIQYTPQGKPQYITDPRSHVWELSHNGLGDLEWVKDPTPAHNMTSFLYDPMGRLRKVTWPAVTGDPPIEEPETSYDTLGRVKRVTNPDQTFWEIVYDGGGRRTKVIDPLGRSTDYFYDPYGRLDFVRDALSGETDYGYDPASNLTSITDAREKTTVFEIDENNRVEKVCYHPGSPDCTTFEEFTYDANGRVETRKDRRNVTTTYVYDGLRRPTSKTYTDGTPPVSLLYDEGGSDQKGRLTSALGGGIALGWSYDLAGQVKSATRTQALSTQAISYTYDPAGNRETLSLNGQLLAEYAWEERNLIETIVRKASPDRTYTYSYDAAGRRKTLAFPNTVTTTYGYDNRSRIGSLTAASPQGTIAQFTYPTHDPLGNRLARGGATAPAEAYGYDELYRLLTVTRTQLVEDYDYDPVGNRRSSLTVPTWNYDDWNRLTSNTNAGFTYDANGNLTQKVDGGFTWTYEWDAENRLKRTLKNGTVVTTYGYDALGRRAERIIRNVPLGSRRYTYDGEDILREGAIAPTDPMRAIHLHGPGIDEPLESVAASGQVSFHHADGLGSIVRATNSSGAVTLSRQYDAFGNPQLGGTQDGYAFTGREWDSETGLYYYRSRHYDPKVGRFISEDPIGFKGGVNFYTYVLDNPVRFTDPFGLEVWPEHVPNGPGLIPGFGDLNCQLGPFQGGLSQGSGTPRVWSGGFGGPMSCGCSATFNLMIRSSAPSGPEMTQFLSGRAWSLGVFAGVGAVARWSPGNGFAIGVGLGAGWSLELGWGKPECDSCTTAEPPPGLAHTLFWRSQGY